MLEKRFHSYFLYLNQYNNYYSIFSVLIIILYDRIKILNIILPFINND